MSPLPLTGAHPGDCERLAGLLAGCVPSCLPLGPQEIQARLPDFEVLRDEDDRPVACAALRELPDGRIEIASVAVHPSRRGEGLGRRMVEAALARARPRGRPLVCVTRCPGFFARLGFRPLGDDPVLHKPGVPEDTGHPPRVAMALVAPVAGRAA